MIIRNKYQILDRIGVGGMGFVYRARHLTFNERCAIKIVKDSIAGDAAFLRRFQTEAIVTRRLRHPNAVRVEDFDYTEDDRPFIVMELVEGKNLSDVLEQEGPLRVPRAVRIAMQVAGAIGVAHKLGIVHRDIKPGNIILTTNEQGQEIAKVLDFGIAKLREAAGEAEPCMTMTGMVVGTPFYMSPEQFMGKKVGEEIDGRTDIYSLGIVLYQMVTAQLPFEGDTLHSLMLQHLKGTLRAPHELKPELEIPESLSRVILRAIAKSRDERFQTGEDFITALDQAANLTSPRSANLLVSPDTTTAWSSHESQISNSGAQHLDLQPRIFSLKHVLRVVALCLLGVLVAGFGYRKYQSVRRERIESEIAEKLKAAASPTLRQAGIRVSVSDAREVTLDGNVPNSEDFTAAQSLAASVPGVVHVTNRVKFMPADSDSLINKGMTFLDSGDYSSAIDCFRRASTDPKVVEAAQKLLDRARQAQQTEEELLKERR